MNPAIVKAVLDSPLSGVFVTLLAYRLALAANRRCHGHPLSNPVLIGVLLVLLWLWLSGSSYAQYMNGARFIQLMLGPATVALAVPLYGNLARLKRAALPLLLSIGIGGAAGMVSAAGLGWWLGLEQPVLVSLATRAVTTPIAMSLAGGLGGVPELAAMFVIVSGILGAVLAPPLFRLIGWHDDMLLGVATGVTAHGIGTARVFHLSETAGAFAGLAMGLNGVFTAMLLPWLVRALGLG
ncbi:LrgB family protein [Chromobacterium sp. IIBBL 290-4]|uniref:LrgB family protein n=1 Tax=Chromobacterium sp. IIBBL 290-4 TaxID=2953890 RepID=UPI0020B72F72|nr:LrgB family protein [Chromobacterium sp. IIBBL 290-4]UTH72489.1 LrgB family protein [Chromobacterium sp. IIBBL 290-4]